MTETSSEKRLSWRGRLVRLVIILIVLILVAFVALWVARKNLALSAMQSWCSGLELTCNGEFSSLGLSGATLDGLEIKRGKDVPFSADSIDVAYGWSTLTKLQVENHRGSPGYSRGT